MTAKKPKIEYRPRPHWDPELSANMPPRDKFYVYGSLCHRSDLFLNPRFPYFLQIITNLQPGKKHISPEELLSEIEEFQSQIDLRSQCHKGGIFRYELGFADPGTRKIIQQKLKARAISIKTSKYKKPKTRYVSEDEFRSRYSSENGYALPLRFLRSRNHKDKRSLTVMPSDIKYASGQLDRVAHLPYTILTTLNYHMNSVKITFEEPMIIFYDKQDYLDARENFVGRPHNQPIRLVRFA